MKIIREIAWFLIGTGMRFGRFAPYIYGIAIGSKPVKIKDGDK